MSNWSPREWYSKVNAHRVDRGVEPLDLDALARLHGSVVHTADTDKPQPAPEADAIEPLEDSYTEESLP